MSLKTLFSLLIFFCFGTLLLAQQASELAIEWQKIIGEARNEIPNEIIAVDDGLLIVGSKHAASGSQLDAYVCKIDYKGVLVWEKQIGGESIENGWCGVAMPNGDLFIGLSRNIDNDHAEIEILKLTKTGEIVWAKKLKSGKNISIGEMKALADGSIIVVGTIANKERTDATVLNAFLTKVNNEGEILWSRNYATEIDDFSNRILGITQEGEGGKAVMELENGNLVVGGFSMSQANMGLATDGWLFMTDDKGEMQWDQSFGAVGGDDVYSVFTMNDSEIVVTGMNYDKPAPFQVSLWSLKFTLDGKLIMENKFAEGNQCTGGHGTINNFNEIFLAGTSKNAKKEWKKMDDLPVQEAKLLKSKGWIVVDYNGNAYLENDNSKTGLKRIHKDYFVLKMSNDLKEIDRLVFGGKDDDEFVSVCTGRDGHVYLLGKTYSAAKRYDIEVMKLK